MSNIYLKVTIEKKIWRSQNFDFLGVKNLSPGQFWGTQTQEDRQTFTTYKNRKLK